MICARKRHALQPLPAYFLSDLDLAQTVTLPASQEPAQPGSPLASAGAPDTDDVIASAFGRNLSVFSSSVNLIVGHINERFGHLLADMNKHRWLTLAKLELCSQIVVQWLCDELHEEPEVRRVRSPWTVTTAELQVLYALRFYATGSFQGTVASDEHVARDQKTVSVAVRAVSVAIVRRLGVQHGWIHFPETSSERFDAERGFRLLGRIPGVIGCVDGTMVSIVGPSKNDPTVTKAAYWCRKYFYALNVMVVASPITTAARATTYSRLENEGFVHFPRGEICFHFRELAAASRQRENVRHRAPPQDASGDRAANFPSSFG
ncbi:putative nuclease HARBI1 isoform X2 [Ixodes scapularis]